MEGTGSNSGKKDKVEDVPLKGDEEEQVHQEEDYLTSGFAKHTEKERLIETFHVFVWPALAAMGWTTKENAEGKTVFLPVGVELKTGKVGVDYYDRIKDVLDRVKERRNDEESKISDAFRREMSRPVHNLPSSPPMARRRRRLPRGSPEKSTPVMDLRWKDGGKEFPKRSSNVGPQYQVSVIPKAGTYLEPSTMKSDSYYDILWDPQEAKEKGIDPEKDDALKEIKHSLKDAALEVMREKNYDMEEIKAAVKDITPIDGSSWDSARKAVFVAEIFRARKDLEVVAQNMGIPMKTCLAFYLGTFKASDDYRLLKTVCCEERLGRVEELENGVDACTICGDGGNLLICDGCDKEYHPTCLRPALASIPEGDWECDECVDSKFLDIRDYLLRQTKLFLPEESRKRKRDDGEPASADDEPDKGSPRPAEVVLEAARMFANAGSAALSKPLPQAEGSPLKTANESDAVSTSVASTEATAMETDKKEDPDTSESKPLPKTEASPMEIDSQESPTPTVAQPLPQTETRQPKIEME